MDRDGRHERDEHSEREERERFEEVEAVCHAYIEEALRIHADIFEELCMDAGKLPPENFIAMADFHIDELACRLKARIRRVAGSARVQMAD